MKSSIRQANCFSASCKAMTVLALAALISSLSISPALAARDDGYRNERHGDQHREWRGNRHGRPEYRRPYGYAQPVYVPPPVYYEPRQSPGISLFFPLDLRR